jgi:ectoine hydroxylase-related dioxygenase (phytanoyl-CoA dioxygenase family)
MTTVTGLQRRQFEQDGFFLLENALSPDELQTLRDECARGIELMHARMDAAGTDTLDISHRGSRYFVGNLHRDSSLMRGIALGPLFQTICRATLGETAFLFFEQFVVKAADGGLKFGWHQDSGYLPLEHRPYITCWVPLDDVDERNGAMSVLPYAEAGVRRKVEHWKEPGTNDLIGYAGEAPGRMVPMKAGSVLVFSSVVLHRSGPNLTTRPRRAWIAQYSPDPILYDDGRPRQNAVPLWDDRSSPG